MKQFIALFILILPVRESFSQTASKQIIEQYCSVNVMPRMLSAKVNIEVDYGNPRKLFSFKDNRVKDDDGRAKKFNTAVEALNYMSTQGWKLVNAMAMTESNNVVYRYVMKREIEVTPGEAKQLEKGVDN